MKKIWNLINGLFKTEEFIDVENQLELLQKEVGLHQLYIVNLSKQIAGDESLKAIVGNALIGLETRLSSIESTCETLAYRIDQLEEVIKRQIVADADATTTELTEKGNSKN